MSPPAESPASDVVRRLRLRVRGVVQGVGFRPFVHRLAERFRLGGWVCNTPAGASIEVEGTGAALAEFLVALQREAPPPAVVEGWESRLLEPVGAREFRIRPSLPSGEAGTTTPDGATCDACLREVFDPANRRYRYAFTNCTTCGPRFTILLALPYDRVNTTMAAFQMCEACRSEYEAPGDRRFHAQPNACPACGPHLTLLGPDGAPQAEWDAALAASAEAIRSGAIVAVKGLGGFHLLVDARSEKAVRRLRARKHREEKPFAVMAPSLNWVERHCELTEPELELLRSPAAPIVLVKRGDTESVAPAVAPESPYLGVLLPYTPLHHLLLADLGFPVVATSGNRADEPLCTEGRQAVERLAGIADLILTHNRPIVRPLDDSVARVVAGEPLLLRRARGYVPLPVRIGRLLPPVLAFGSHLKNTLALSVGAGVVLSGHHGDLETAHAVDAVRDSVVDLIRLYGRRPEAVACDHNADYASSQVAEQLAQVESVPLVRVQHHHAHVLACMAEHWLEGPVLGVCWDGAGAGGDGTVWGGEFLVAAGSDYRRVAHLREFRLPGGDQAAREPRRAALGLLLEMLGPAALESELAPVLAFTRRQLQVLLKLVESGFQCPPTSSAGRLFDAVASLLNLRQVSGFEGQAAMALEHAALECRTDDVYPFTLCWQDEKPGVIDWEPLVRALLEEHLAGEGAPRIAAKVHNTLVEAIVAVARRVREPRVVLTGGCFQNKYLTERAVVRLREEGFHPYWQRRAPPNDGGLSLGQVMAAVHLIEGS